MSGSSKTPIYGPEPWATTNKTEWSYWDLWFCVVVLADHDGDLDELTVAIEEGGRLSGGGTAEAKLSQLDDLRRRMAQAGIDAQTLVAGEDTDPKIRAVVSSPIVMTGLFSRSSPNIAHRATYAQTLTRQQHRQSVALFFGSSPFAAPRAAVAVLVLVAPSLLAGRVLDA